MKTVDNTAGAGRDDGFTLLEVMVSLAVISVSLAFLLQSQNNAVRVVGSAGLETRAAIVADEKLGRAQTDSTLATSAVQRWYAEETYNEFVYKYESKPTPIPTLTELKVIVAIKAGSAVVSEPKPDGEPVFEVSTLRASTLGAAMNQGG